MKEILAAAFALLVTEAAIACSCENKDGALLTNLEQYERIFEGSVEDMQIREVQRGPFLSRVNVVQLRVQRVWQGPVREGQSMVMRLEDNPCQMPLEPSGRYLLFTSRGKYGEVISRCSPSARADEAGALRAALERISAE